MKESNVQSAICDYLALRKHFFSRINNVPVYDSARDRYRALPKHTMPGFPDIIVIKDGFFVGLEVKGPGGRQSPEQKEFERACKAAGGEYYVVRSIDDVREIGL